jgi:head-tail adaptor
MSGEFAGTLRERILIEQPVAARTATGLAAGEWDRVCSCLAAIVPDGAGAEAEGMALSAMPRFRVTIRTRPGITVDQRVTWAGRRMMVRQIAADPRARDRIRS